jgi:hypothetical protein
MQQFDKVKLNLNYTRILNDSMKEWMAEHKDIIFKVEKISDETVKLYKVDFWITKDLLEVISG